MATKFEQLSRWFDNPIGQALLQSEKKHLLSYWHRAKGKSLLTLGHEFQNDLIMLSGIARSFLVSPVADHQVAHSHTICADFEELPILPQSMDVVFLPHVLEFTDNPYQVLREVDRVLQPEGYLIIISFNPISFFGIKRLFSWRKQVPWSGNFRRPKRVADWLNLLNYNVIATKMIFYRPPIKKQKLLSKLMFLDNMGKTLLRPCGGGAYILMAQKKVWGMTGITPQWRSLKNVNNGMIKHAPRGAHREQTN